MLELKNKLIENIKNNTITIILCLYIFLPIFFLPVSVLISEKVYKIIFVLFNIGFIILSYIKTKKIFLKKEIALGIILCVMFLIDFLIRKNTYTISTYTVAIKSIILPYYYFNRIEKKADMLEYLSLFGKVATVFYLFDPLFHYFFTSTYMGYGFSIMLPSFLAIYVYHFIKPSDNDYLFLITGLIAIVVFANRNCTLAILFMIFLSRKYIKQSFKNRKKGILHDKIRLKAFAKKNGIILGLLLLSFGFNYCIAKIDYNIKNPPMEIEEKANNIIEPANNNKNDKESDSVNNNGSVPKIVENKDKSVEKNADDTDINKDNGNKTNTGSNKAKDDNYEVNLRSYSFDKYLQVLRGKTDRILSGRIKVYKDVFEVIKRDIVSGIVSLLFGRGTGYFMHLYNGVYTHCIFFDLFIEYGIVGLLLFISLLIYCIYKFAKNMTKKKEIYLLGIYFLTIAFPKLLLSSYFQKETNLFLFIFLVLGLYPIDYKKIISKFKNKKM